MSCSTPSAVFLAVHRSFHSTCDTHCLLYNLISQEYIISDPYFVWNLCKLPLCNIILFPRVQGSVRQYSVLNTTNPNMSTVTISFMQVAAYRPNCLERGYRFKISSDRPDPLSLQFFGTARPIKTLYKISITVHWYYNSSLFSQY